MVIFYNPSNGHQELLKLVRNNNNNNNKSPPACCGQDFSFMNWLRCFLLAALSTKNRKKKEKRKKEAWEELIHEDFRGFILN